MSRRDRYEPPGRPARGGAPMRRGRRARGYDADAGRYGTPMPGTAGYPSARWGWGPIGWSGGTPGLEFWPYADVPGYGFAGSYHAPRRAPRQSPTYGRRGDRELRRWAGRYGYDLGYAIPPRRRG